MSKSLSVLSEKIVVDSNELNVVNDNSEVTTSFKNNGLSKFFAYVVFFFVLTPSYAFAQDLGDNFLENFVELFTNVWARSLAIIAVAIAGYLFIYSKQIDKQMFFRIAGGIFLIFGGTTIIDEVSSYI